MPEITPVMGHATITDGKYNVRLTSVDVESKTSQKGVPYSQLVCKLEVFANQDDRLNGQLIFDRVTFSGDGMTFRWPGFWKAVTGEQWAEGTTFDTDNLLGRELTVAVASDSYGPKVKSHLTLEA